MTNELHTKHREIADKLLDKVRDASGDDVFAKIQSYNAIIATWQARINTEHAIEQLQAQQAKPENLPVMDKVAE